MCTCEREGKPPHQERERERVCVCVSMCVCVMRRRIAALVSTLPSSHVCIHPPTLPDHQAPLPGPLLPSFVAGAIAPLSLPSALRIGRTRAFVRAVQQHCRHIVSLLFLCQVRFSNAAALALCLCLLVCGCGCDSVLLVCCVALLR